MKRLYQITFTEKEKGRIFFENLGVKFNKIANVYFFKISDDEKLWPEVKAYIDKENLDVQSAAKFSKKDIISADWCLIFPQFIYGYPMPENDFGYKELSYNAGEECESCGINCRQIKPIHLKGEPPFTNKDFMSINWTFDIFVRPEIINILQENNIQGYEIWPVIHYKKNENLKSIQQLYIPDKQIVTVFGDNLKIDYTKCSHLKYEVPKMEQFKILYDTAFDKFDF